MEKAITLIAWRRPAYTQQLIDALARCEGIETYTVFAFVDPGDDEVLEMLQDGLGFARKSLVVQNDQQKGVSDNTFQALSVGFRAADFVIHFEDDCIPAPDTLRFFEFCRDKYREDEIVFSVSGYSRFEPLTDQTHQVVRQKWFTPWGWATWQARWQEMKGQWFHGSTIWDKFLNVWVREGRCQIVPVLSRIQNIGAEGGVNVRSAQWHAQHHHTKYWAGDFTLPQGDFWEERSQG